jgi:hypothetical protein
MIQIKKSQTADTRSCDFARVSKNQLLDSSRQHIADVAQAMALFQGLLLRSAAVHDYDKLTDIDWFHSDFTTGFKETGWWDNHRKIHRHHLAQEDGIPRDVNILDLLEYIADCVMAGKARTGTVFPLVVTPELLDRAFKNTVQLLSENVEVLSDSEYLDKRGFRIAPDGYQPEPDIHEIEMVGSELWIKDKEEAK